LNEKLILNFTRREKETATVSRLWNKGYDNNLKAEEFLLKLKFPLKVWDSHFTCGYSYSNFNNEMANLPPAPPLPPNFVVIKRK